MMSSLSSLSTPAVLDAGISFGRTFLELKLPGWCEESHWHRAERAVVFVSERYSSKTKWSKYWKKL
jgi:hypothetical protein